MSLMGFHIGLIWSSFCLSACRVGLYLYAYRDILFSDDDDDDALIGA